MKLIQRIYRGLVPYKIRVLRGRVIRNRKLIGDEFRSTKSIFVHIPKTAGSSVANAIYGHDKPGHYPASKYRAKLMEEQYDYIFFTFVRHPVDRFVSAYNYLKGAGKNESDREFGRAVVSKYSCINQFVDEWLNEGTIWTYIHFYPQSYFIYDGEYLLVDFVGKFEILEKDFKRLTYLLGLNARNLPHSNRSAESGEVNIISGASIKKLKQYIKMTSINWVINAHNDIDE